jgi:integrase
MGEAWRACASEAISKGHSQQVGKEGRETSDGRGKTMSLYKRGDVWWYKFRFAGQMIRESTKSDSRTIARDAERARRRELEQGFNRIERQRAARLFSIAAEEWLASKRAHLAARSVAIEQANLKHLNPFFGKMLLCDIRADDVAAYQVARLQQKASPKTVNLEIGTLRAVLRKNRLWFAIQPDVRMLRTSVDVGRAINREEESALLTACQSSRSRSLHAAVLLALNTCMRYSELRLLRWEQVNLAARTVTVGLSKTEAGAGRVIPLNARALSVLSFWAGLFPEREPNHYVFPSEKYGIAQCEDKKKGLTRTYIYDTDPTTPIGRWKEAWEASKIRADVKCRFHDLRHTGCTRMLEAGVPFSVVATIMGWSASTTVRMSKRYGHIGHSAQRLAVEAICEPVVAVSEPDGAQNGAQSENVAVRALAN